MSEAEVQTGSEELPIPPSDKPPERIRKSDSYEAKILVDAWEHIHIENGHFAAAIVGPEGDGKSATALRIGYELDPTFHAGRVIYDIEELVDVLLEERHHPGYFYVLDEAGKEFGKRSWYDKDQILANQLLQIIRDENLGLLLTLPALGDLDSQTKRRLQGFFEITSKQHNVEISGKWKWIDPDRADQTNKDYHYYPRLKVNGRRVRVTRLRFAYGQIPEELWEAYTERKRAFQKDAYQEFKDQVNGVDPEEENGTDYTELAAQVVDDPEPFMAYHNAHKTHYLSADLIELELELSVNEAKKVKHLAAKELEE